MTLHVFTPQDDKPVLVRGDRVWRFPGRYDRGPAVHLAVTGGWVALTPDEAVQLADALHDAAEHLDPHS